MWTPTGLLIQVQGVRLSDQPDRIDQHMQTTSRRLQMSQGLLEVPSALVETGPVGHGELETKVQQKDLLRQEERDHNKISRI